MSSFDKAFRGITGTGGYTPRAAFSYKAKVDMYENTQGSLNWQAQEKGRKWYEGRSAGAFWAPNWSGPARAGWIIYYRWEGSPTKGTKPVSQGGSRVVDSLETAKTLMRDWVEKGVIRAPRASENEALMNFMRGGH